MAVQESSYRRPWGLAKVLMCLSVVVFVAVFVLKSWGDVQPYFAGMEKTITQPIAPAAHPTPIQNVYSSQSEADAAVATAVAGGEQRAAPVPNVNNTGDSAPLERQSMTVDRQPAPAYAPTSEPLPQTQVDGAFGSKPAPPVDIQATHQCKHAQVWTDAGCKNPTPTQ